MKTRSIAQWSAALGLTVFAAGCGREAPEPPPVARPVKIITVGGEGIGLVREFPGTIRATQEAELSFEVAGRIIERLADEGQPVKEGDVLARLDDSNFQAGLAAAAAGLHKAQADLNRSLRIREEDPGAISTSKIDADRRAVDVMDAEVQIAQKAVDDAVLRAPFSGVVARRMMENYQNVQAKEPVMFLQDISQLEIEISLPERDITQGQLNKSPEELTKRSSPKVEISSLPERSFSARVSEFATRADPATRTFQVRLVFEPPDDVAVLPGMTARVTVTLEHDDSTQLPSHAVFADEGGASHVWRVNPDAMTAHAVPVKPGALVGGDINIIEGLTAGDQVVVSGVSQLREGVKVRRYER
jgi:RND family efflux transporter MFP subunit